MTTAARPTFDPARGGQGRGEKDLSAISRQYSSRDLPGHTKLKYREQGQGTTEELRSRDFRKELDDREKDTKVPGVRRQNEPSTKRPKMDQVPAASLDADDPLEGDSSDSDDSDDDTAALLAELNKIKKERAIEQAKKEAEKKQEEERIRMENILSGNPLLNYSSATQKNELRKVLWIGLRVVKYAYRQLPQSLFAAPRLAAEEITRFNKLQIKRRWDDDVVFKNCARSEPEKKANTFINDSLRSEFHKKFMEKYVK